MQAHQHQGGSQKATTERTRPTMASHRLDLPSICDICGKARSTRKHQECSRIRQQQKATEWAAQMAENAASKLNKGRRHA